MGQTTASPSEALQILEQNERGKFVFHRCKVFSDEEALFLTSTIMLSSSTHRGNLKTSSSPTSCARHFSIKSKSKLCCHWKQSMARDKSHMATHHSAIQLDGMAITVKKKAISFLFPYISSHHPLTSLQDNAIPVPIITSWYGKVDLSGQWMVSHF